MKFLLILAFCLVSALAKRLSTPIKPSKGVGIIGGEDAGSGQYPFAAAIDVQTSSSRFFCGGTLINNDWVLTSGQCTNGAVGFTIRVGSPKLTGTDANRVTLASSHSVTHPDFDPVTNFNDVGLIQLRIPIEFTSYIRSIGLGATALPDTASPIALGWGQTSDDNSDLSDQLQYVRISVVPEAECKTIYGNQITNNTVCVSGNYNEGTCYGDSGSPLLAKLTEGTSWHHVGIASFFSGNGCESTDPSGYTRTANYIDWINNVTASSDYY